VIYPLDSVIHPLNNPAQKNMTAADMISQQQLYLKYFWRCHRNKILKARLVFK